MAEGGALAVDGQNNAVLGEAMGVFGGVLVLAHGHSTLGLRSLASSTEAVGLITTMVSRPVFDEPLASCHCQRALHTYRTGRFSRDRYARRPASRSVIAPTSSRSGAGASSTA